MYDSIMVLARLNITVTLIIVYCIKQLLFTFLNHDKPDQSQPTVQQEGLSKQLDDLSQKIADLSTKQLTQFATKCSKHIFFYYLFYYSNGNKFMSLQLHLQVLWTLSIKWLIGTAESQHNVVVCNLTEHNDHKTDIETFKALSSDALKLDVNITKAIRLGPKITNKQRPLLLTVEDTNDKIQLLSHSHFLKRYDQYNRIYIVPDRTKLVHAKHRKVVEELKQRQAQGETGLIIRNGVVIHKQLHCNNSTQDSDIRNVWQRTNQSS